MVKVQRFWACDECKSVGRVVRELDKPLADTAGITEFAENDSAFIQEIFEQHTHYSLNCTGVPYLVERWISKGVADLVKNDVFGHIEKIALEECRNNAESNKK